MAATMSASASVDDRLTCLECGFRSHVLVGHVAEAHGMTPASYIEAHGGAPTMSERAMESLRVAGTGSVARSSIPLPEALTVKLMGMELPVDCGVPAGVCKALPKGYQFPTKGKALSAFKRALMALARGRNCFIWGMPGTGKDALVHAFSASTRRPVVEVTFRPGTDLAPWFYTRAIDSVGTGWEYGHLWRALTEGVEGRDGVRRPVLVLLSDVDRADSAQAEWFRILTDSMGGRIMDPHGRMVPLVVGTQFVCTANSCGSGDARGRMSSSNPIDASILDRLGRKIEAAYMTWEDEGAILRGKFPVVAESAPEVFEQLGNATEAIRKAIENEVIYSEFSHRALCEILAEVEDHLHFAGGRAPAHLLKKGFRAWMDGLDEDSRLEARRTVDPHLAGGALSDDVEEDSSPE